MFVCTVVTMENVVATVVAIDETVVTADAMVVPMVIAVVTFVETERQEYKTIFLNFQTINTENSACT